ncbi:MAG: hypothetical protein EX263_00760 [Flavobacteriaceae bacterium]|jgi:hypothetical protein|nr:MAG: hypothetical protein EX263_00760 [Flavobacteriaceae bacterium]
MKKRLLRYERIELSNRLDDIISIWYSRPTKNFVLQLNGKVITTTKEFESIETSLENISAFGQIFEVDI